MIKITRTQVRPNTSVRFYSPPEEKAMYTVTNFVNTGLLTITHNLSENQLTKVSTWIWENQDSLDAYNSNELVITNRSAEIAYHNAVGITFTETIENI
jgi:hypothetical protein